MRALVKTLASCDISSLPGTPKYEPQKADGGWRKGVTASRVPHCPTPTHRTTDRLAGGVTAVGHGRCR